MAAYRDIQNANWRSVIAVPKNVATTVTIEAGAAGLMTAATPAGQHEVTWSDRR
jgi:predicted component of type VI protein secretion system